jgi:ParB-like chromosome segregation protein Spo0J
MASIEEAGQQSPVIVVAAEEPGRWVLIEGRKRVRALKRLKAQAVNAVVWELAPAEALIAAYQLQDGSGWNALEEGWLVWELVRGGRLTR